MIADAVAEAPAPVVLPFAPGDGRVYRLEVEHRREAPGAPMRFTSRRTVRFDRDGEGWRMTTVLDEARSDAGARGDMVFAAGKRPFLGVAVVARLDGDGRILEVVDEAALWTRFRAGQDAVAPIVAGAEDRPAVDRAAVAAVVRAILDAPEAVRRQHLLGDVEPMLAQAGRTVRSAAPVPVAGGAGGGTGALTLVDADPRHARVRIETRSGAGAVERVHDVRDSRVDRETGLVAEDRRVRTVGAGAAATILSETRRLAAAD